MFFLHLENHMLMKLSPWPYTSAHRKIVASGNSAFTASSPWYFVLNHWEPPGRKTTSGSGLAFRWLKWTNLDAHLLADSGQGGGARHVDVLVVEVHSLEGAARAVDDNVGVGDGSPDGILVSQLKWTEENLAEITTDLHPHHLVMFTSVGENHLRTVLSQPVGDASSDEAI